jgi:hypothetical protein
MVDDKRCPVCLQKGLLRPLLPAFADGRCFNHSSAPEAVAVRAGRGRAGREEAKARKAKRIAGPTKGVGVSAAAAPEYRPPASSLASLPLIDLSSADAVTATMERIVSSLFASEGVTPDTVKAAHPYCATAQAIRAPKGTGNAGPKEKGRKIITFIDAPSVVAPTH